MQTIRDLYINPTYVLNLTRAEFFISILLLSCKKLLASFLVVAVLLLLESLLLSMQQSLHPSLLPFCIEACHVCSIRHALL